MPTQKNTNKFPTRKPHSRQHEKQTNTTFRMFKITEGTTFRLCEYNI